MLSKNRKFIQNRLLSQCPFIHKKTPLMKNILFLTSLILSIFTHSQMVLKETLIAESEDVSLYLINKDSLTYDLNRIVLRSSTDRKYVVYMIGGRISGPFDCTSAPLSNHRSGTGIWMVRPGRFVNRIHLGVYCMEEGRMVEVLLKSFRLGNDQLSTMND